MGGKRERERRKRKSVDCVLSSLARSNFRTVACRCVYTIKDAEAMNVMHTLRLSPGAYCDRNVPLIALERASNLACEDY